MSLPPSHSQLKAQPVPPPNADAGRAFLTRAFNSSVCSLSLCVCTRREISTPTLRQARARWLISKDSVWSFLQASQQALLQVEKLRIRDGLEPKDPHSLLHIPSSPENITPVSRVLLTLNCTHGPGNAAVNRSTCSRQRDRKETHRQEIQGDLGLQDVLPESSQCLLCCRHKSTPEAQSLAGRLFLTYKSGLGSPSLQLSFYRRL